MPGPSASGNTILGEVYIRRKEKNIFRMHTIGGHMPSKYAAGGLLCIVGEIHANGINNLTI